MPSRPTIRLKPREGRRARAGAPWIFSNEIVMDAAARALPPGTLVNVVSEDKDKHAFGTGYFNPGTLIAVRLFECPADTAIDQAFFAARLRAALARRAALFEQPYYRLVHAEGDRLPGLVIDRFADVLVLQISTAGMEGLQAPLLAALDEVIAPETVVLRADAQARALEGLETYVRAAKGDIPQRLRVDENGVAYLADAGAGQKTGWYFDQRDNRAFIAKLARGRTVLDAYCYTGGFSLLAAKSGATETAGIDSSQPALALAEEAASLNGAGAHCRFVKADVMEELARLAEARERFDIVVADPPPFVRARKDIESGARAYRKLARLAAGLASPGGFLLLASCSHNIWAERFAEECAAGIRRADRRAVLVHSAGAGPDHPVHPILLETAYLKALVYALD